MSNEYMTVHEMGDLLGLKKTERYHIVHKNYFRTVKIGGQMMVDRADFERWYQNQTKYGKIYEENSSRDRREDSVNAKYIAEDLNLSEARAINLLSFPGLKEYRFTIDNTYWVPKERYEKWYRYQNHYMNKEDREYIEEQKKGTLSRPEAARRLGITRDKFYSLMNNRLYASILQVVIIGDEVRITEESFNEFLQVFRSGDKKHIGRDRKKKRTLSLKEDKNPGYYTKKAASIVAEVSENTVSKWIYQEKFPVIYIGKFIRIPKEAFHEWLKQKNKEAC